MKIDTTLRQWCPDCQKATVSRMCIYAPQTCCAECCAPGRLQCEDDADDLAWEDDEG